MWYEDLDIRLSVRYQHHTWAAFSMVESMLSTVWEADGSQKRSGLCGRKESLLVIDALNSSFGLFREFCMYGPTPLDTTCLSFDERFSTFCLRHRQCHLRTLRLSRYRVWSVYVVPQVFLCRVSLCYLHIGLCTYIVYVVNSYAHTVPYSHAALLCFSFVTVQYCYCCFPFLLRFLWYPRGSLVGHVVCPWRHVVLSYLSLSFF
jgi:hypothetical protein